MLLITIPARISRMLREMIDVTKNIRVRAKDPFTLVCAYIEM